MLVNGFLLFTIAKPYCLGSGKIILFLSRFL